jgi:hypothetical protein
MLLHHALIDLKQRRRSSSPPQYSKEPSPRSSLSKFNPLSGSNDKHREIQDRKNRYELVVSRLVRLHWDPLHMSRVTEEYRDKNGLFVEDDIEEHVNPGEFQEFCLALVEGRR